MKLTELLSAKEYIKKPVYYDLDSAIIFDAADNHLLDVRGWGRLQNLTNGATIQDSIGMYIAECINSCPDELILTKQP